MDYDDNDELPDLKFNGENEVGNNDGENDDQEMSDDDDAPDLDKSTSTRVFTIRGAESCHTLPWRADRLRSGG